MIAQAEVLILLLTLKPPAFTYHLGDFICSIHSDLGVLLPLTSCLPCRSVAFVRSTASCVSVRQNLSLFDEINGV